MKPIRVLTSEISDGACLISDSDGQHIHSNDPAELLTFIASRNGNAFNVVFNLDKFIKPVKELMPRRVVTELMEKERVTWQGFKLFYPDIKGGLLGVNCKAPIKPGSTIVDIHDAFVYDISQYFPGEELTPHDTLDKGNLLLKTLRGMGISPTKLTSPAAMFESAVLDKIPYANIYTLPDESLDLMEWAYNYIREWRSIYKVGIFEHGVAKDYDLTAAYPSIIAALPDMAKAKFYHTDGEIPGNAAWGLSRAVIDVKTDISFLVGDDEVCRKGQYIDLISNEETAYCRQTGKATIKPVASWYFTLPDNRLIFDYTMRRLYELRSGSELQTSLAKAFAVSVWGKFQQMIKGKPGDHANFIYASIVASRCRLKVARFIDSNSLDDSLVSVTVDGVIATKDLPVSTVKAFGEWRKNPDSSAVVLDSDFQWIGNKRQLGITAAELIAEIKRHPGRQSWYGVYLSLLERDRHFKEWPQNGHDLLRKIYSSGPIDS